MLKYIWAIFLPLIYAQSPPTTVRPPPSCVNVEDFTYIASLNDCRLYYQCIAGEAFQLQCPRGNYFSTEGQTCVPYDESDCPLLTPPPPVVPTCDDVPEFGYIPSLDACDYYYQCFLGEQWLLKCPRGLYFSFEHQSCVYRDESDCSLWGTTTRPPPPSPPPPPPIPTCDNVPEFSYIPSFNNCALYYQCFGGEQWQLQCPRGNYFSFLNQTCVAYGESDCPLLNTPPPGPTGSPPTGPPPTGPPPPPTGPPPTAPPLPPSQEPCDGENCYKSIETVPIFRERQPKLKFLLL